MKKENNFVDKCFKDEKGNRVLGEKPNLPIIVWIVSVILQRFIEGRLYVFVELVGFGAIFTWAWLEIFQGTNYFRRLLGLIVMTVTLYSRLY